MEEESIMRDHQGVQAANGGDDYYGHEIVKSAQFIEHQDRRDFNCACCKFPVVDPIICFK